MWYNATWQIGRKLMSIFWWENKEEDWVSRFLWNTRNYLSAKLQGSTSQNTTTLLQCFPNRVPWNPQVGQDIVRGSVRNHRTSTQVFWNTARNYKYTPKYHKNFFKQLAILVQTAACLYWPYWCKQLPVYTGHTGANSCLFILFLFL
jgi:hypothetical protein